ncbi:hypothetical protein FGO68_gene7825 [Halteria grandinella]|uniref:Uncharacterized protein n=1 Tax=Halteria grandinella TaxID=5974 RepID=A0A8J8NYU4_HALGN|nr:hypothetical protein FGO68_gene7825 [Halteria grandinella]
MKFLEQSPIVMLWNFYYEIIDLFQLQPLLEELGTNSINLILRFKLQKIQQQVDLLDQLQKKQLPGPIKLNLIETEEFKPKVEHTHLLNKINSLLPSDLKMADISIIDRVRSELDTIGVIGIYVSQRVQMESKFEQQALLIKENQEGLQKMQNIFKEQFEQLNQQNKLLEEKQKEVFEPKENFEKLNEQTALIKQLQEQQAQFQARMILEYQEKKFSTKLYFYKSRKLSKSSSCSKIGCLRNAKISIFKKSDCSKNSRINNFNCKQKCLKNSKSNNLKCK